MDYKLADGWTVAGDEDEKVWYVDNAWNDRHIVNEIWSSCVYDACLKEDSSATLVDVGAHKGYFAMRACWLLPSVRVHCYEPDPRSARILMENAARNGILGRIELFPEAVGEQDGFTELWLDKRSGKSCLAGLVEEGAPTKYGGEWHSVRMVSLNAVLGRVDGRSPRIKMDIEGAEFDAFRGKSPAELQEVDSIVLEYHERWGDSNELRELFRLAGFAVRRTTKPPLLVATR
jgi:FkbM family methyltransferase